MIKLGGLVTTKPLKEDLVTEGLSGVLLTTKIPIKGESKSENIEFSVLTPAVGFAVPKKEIQFVPKKDTELIELFPIAAAKYRADPMIGIREVLYPQIAEYANKKLGLPTKPYPGTRTKGFLILIDLESIITKLK